MLFIKKIILLFNKISKNNLFKPGANKAVANVVPVF